MRTNHAIAAAELRYLRDNAALPEYLDLLENKELDFYGYIGLIGLPLEQSTLDALWRKIRNDADFPISMNALGCVNLLSWRLAPGEWNTKNERASFAKEIAKVLDNKNPSARFRTMSFLSGSTNDPSYRQKMIALLPELEGDPEFARLVWELGSSNDPAVRPALKAIRSKLSESHAAIVDGELARRPD